MISSCQFMVVLVFASYFVGLEAQTASSCPSALITGGVGTCPSGLILFSTTNTCCNCTGPLIVACQTGSFPSTDNSQCCSVPTTTTNTTITNTTTTCVDLTNSLTGTSDCAARVSLCNNTLYYTLMTQQCPRTCNRCSSTSTTTNTSCTDQLNSRTGTSDCSRVSYLCNNTLYSTLMRSQCPVTCGFCSSSSSNSTLTSTTCVDLTNTTTGISSCPGLTAYCNNTIYATLMRQQCPKTCGFCTTTLTG